MTITRKRKVKKTSSLKNNKYIIVEKYEKNILGIITHVYIIKFKNNFSCEKPLTMKKLSIKKKIFEQINLSYDLLGYLLENKIKSVKLNKYDKNITNKLASIFNVNEKYTYCLKNDKLILAETKTSVNNSKVKDYMSKHIVLCKKKSCATGEMVFYKNAKSDYELIFDNASGTFEPSTNDLQNLKKAFPYLNIMTTNMISENHKKYFNSL